jgi:gliding motility-associated-like protein
MKNRCWYFQNSLTNNCLAVEFSYFHATLISRTVTYIFFAFFMTVATVANAQLCTGSLGDPVVNISFGDGSSGSTGYTPTNAYTYTQDQCPNDGFYTITRQTQNCFGSAWHTVTNDHTGGGAFLLVNATVTPGDFFVTTVNNLCPNTTYEFAAWMMNVLARSGIRPNVTFTIETTSGTIIRSYNTGNIFETPQPRWDQYGFFFTSPANDTAIVLRMRNNAPGGNGNDIALDDITFRPCGPGINANIVGRSNPIEQCEGINNIFNFSAVISGGFNTPAYQWQNSRDSGLNWTDIPGATQLTYTKPATGTGIFWYRLTAAEQSAINLLQCRVASPPLKIIISPNPKVNAGPDRIMLSGDSIQLMALATPNNADFAWTPGQFLSNAQVLQPFASPPANQNYVLTATTPLGCTGNDEVFVKVVAAIFVPTAFSPNGDRLNDRWRIPFLDPLFGARVSVFNRLGQMVYDVNGKMVDWDGSIDGTKQPAGLYIYQIIFPKNRKPMRGQLLLIR